MVIKIVDADINISVPFKSLVSSIKRLKYQEKLELLEMIEEQLTFTTLIFRITNGSSIHLDKNRIRLQCGSIFGASHEMFTSGVGEAPRIQ